MMNLLTFGFLGVSLALAIYLNSFLDKRNQRRSEQTRDNVRR